LAFGGMDAGEATVFSVLFAWGRVVLVKSFLNYRAASFSRASLFGLFFWSVLLVFSGCQLLVFQVWVM